MKYTFPAPYTAGIIRNMRTRDENFVKISRIAAAFRIEHIRSRLFNEFSICTRSTRLISWIKSASERPSLRVPSQSIRLFRSVMRPTCAHARALPVSTQYDCWLAIRKVFFIRSSDVALMRSGEPRSASDSSFSSSSALLRSPDGQMTDDI